VAASPVTKAWFGWQLCKGWLHHCKNSPAAANGFFDQMGVRSQVEGAYRVAVPQSGRTAMAASQDDWIKQLEAELSTLAADMWATQKRLEEKGFRIDGGNKTATGWWLTANKRTMNPGNIKVQSDGTTISVTAET
jgi:hypothetical protein